MYNCDLQTILVNLRSSERGLKSKANPTAHFYGPSNFLRSVYHIRRPQLSTQNLVCDLSTVRSPFGLFWSIVEWIIGLDFQKKFITSYKTCLLPMELSKNLRIVSWNCVSRPFSYFFIFLTFKVLQYPLEKIHHRLKLKIIWIE